MDLDLFGMGDFSLDDLSCDVLVIGPASHEEEWTGEAVWQSVILSPFGYEVSMVNPYEQEEKREWMTRECRKNGIDISEDPWKDAEKCKVISICGLYDENMMDLSDLKSILETGKKNQVLVCLDPGDVGDVDSARAILKEMAPLIDYFLPNEEEAKLLSDKKILPEIAQDFLDMGVKTVVITTGMNGCFVRGDGAPFAMGAIWGECKDLCGVGANFAAGLIHGLFQDWQMKTICEFATGCAAICKKYLGPVEAARERKEEIKKILNNPYM